MEIELPDGTVLDAPDDADVKTVVQNYQRKQELATMRERARISYSAMPTGQRLFAGYGRPFVELGLGIKDLAGKAGVGEGLTDRDRITLERLEQIDGGAGTAGRIAGEIATFAGPGGLASKGATMLPRAAARFAPRVATDAAAAAGMEALKAPTESTSRGDRAAWGAAGAGLGHAATSALATAVRGVRPTAQARELMDQGVPLTAGMAKGGVLQSIEQQLAKVPIIGGAIRNRQQDALKGWNRSLLNRAMPEGQATQAGHEGVRQATDAFKSAYGKLWNKPITLDVGQLQSLWWKTVDASQKNLAPEVSNALNGKLYRIFSESILPASNGKITQGAAISAVDDALRTEATRAARAGMGDAAQLFSQARAQLRSLLPSEVSTELGRIDGLYAQFARMRRAAGYRGAAANGGQFTPDQLLSAATAMDRSAGKGATARGEALMQPQATAARQVLGNTSAKPPGTLESAALGAASLAAAPATLAGRAAYSGPMQRYVTGRTNPQRWLEEAYAESSPQALLNALRRSGVTPGTVGAAAMEDQQ